MNLVAMLRDMSLLWLIFLTFVAILPMGVILFFAIKGMHRLRQLAKQVLPIAQDKAGQVAAVTERASQKVADPIIRAEVKRAEVGGVARAILRRKKA